MIQSQEKPNGCQVAVPLLRGKPFAGTDYNVMRISFALHDEMGCKWINERWVPGK